MINEPGRALSGWITVLPAIQWALNKATRRIFGTTPFHVMMGREPRTAFAALVEETEEVEITPVDEEKLRQYVRGIFEAQEQLQRETVERSESERQRARQAISRGDLPHFTVGDYVLVARARKGGRHAKLMNTWTRPWKVVSDDREHVYTVEYIISGDVHDAHVARLKFYADKELNVTRRIQEISHTWSTSPNIISTASRG